MVNSTSTEVVHDGSVFRVLLPVDVLKLIGVVNHVTRPGVVGLIPTLDTIPTPFIVIEEIDPVYVPDGEGTIGDISLADIVLKVAVPAPSVARNCVDVPPTLGYSNVPDDN